MISLVIVSHSYKVAEGVKELAEQVGQHRVGLYAAGGLDETTLGTNVERIGAALKQAAQNGDVLVLVDMGSAVLSTQMALELLPDDLRARVTLSGASLVEGAIMACIEASVGADIGRVKAAAEVARDVPKLE